MQRSTSQLFSIPGLHDRTGPRRTRPARRCAAALLLALAGCGGGGGGGGDTDGTPPPPVEPPPLGTLCLNGSIARLAGDTELKVGQATELSLLSCGNSALVDPRWTQLSGAALTLMSARSQALSLELPAAGEYRLQLRYRDAAGRSQSAELPLRGLADAQPGLSVRGEPSVWSGGSLSLRAWPRGLSEAELAGAKTLWSVMDGPAPSLDRTDDDALIFKAPQVGADSLLRLRATLSLADGRRFSDEFSLLVQPPPVPQGTPLFDASNPASRVYPFRDDSPHAAALADCIYSPMLTTSPNTLCTLGKLPLLGQAAPGQAPTVEQIMQRVLVSNDWMGEVFERFLREQDPQGDFRRMLAATTAVVIGGRVRPAFYWSATGAIYLDASYLWLTPQQRDTLSESPDPRSAYGKALSYSTPWRYVLDNRYATRALPVKERASRSLAETRHELARLLYHELAHAADFVPPRVHAALDPARRVYEAGPSQTASLSLQQRLPFLSQEMVGLGRVQFFGATATATQMAYTPADITRFFSQDRVTDDYSYSLPEGQSVPREDAAMLVEEALMQLRYGVLRDVAVTPRLQDGASSADLVLDWGQRGRVGEAAIRPRVELVLGELMPWLMPGISQGLAAPLPLRAGLSWGQNLDQAALAQGQPRALTEAERRTEQALRAEQGARDEQLRRIQSRRLPEREQAR